MFLGLERGRHRAETGEQSESPGTHASLGLCTTPGIHAPLWFKLGLLHVWAWHPLAYLSFRILWAIYEACQEATCHKPCGSLQQRAVSFPAINQESTCWPRPRQPGQVHTINPELTPQCPTAMSRRTAHQMAFSTPTRHAYQLQLPASPTRTPSIFPTLWIQSTNGGKLHLY